jgi:hypothetical protein
MAHLLPHTYAQNHGAPAVHRDYTISSWDVLQTRIIFTRVGFCLLPISNGTEAPLGYGLGVVGNVPLFGWILGGALTPEDHSPH